MAAIFEEVNITWGYDDEGEPAVYTVTPTYRMVQKIEQNISIAGLSARIANGEPPISQISEVLAVLLRNGGCDVTAEDVYEELFSISDPDTFQALAETVVTAFVPSGKSDSQGSGIKGKDKSKTKT